MRMKSVLLALSLVFTVGATGARADLVTTYGFYGIEGTAFNKNVGASQLTVTVSDYGNNQVLFTFTNVGLQPCSITDVYFDDGSLLALAGVVNGPGVDFLQDELDTVNPSELPGGVPYDWETSWYQYDEWNKKKQKWVTQTAYMSGSSDSGNPGVMTNGVNPGESMGIYFDLKLGRIWSDVLTDLETTALRVGLHVQGFGDGGSGAFINQQVPIPAPAAVVLGAMGVGLVAWIKRRGA